MASFAVVLLAAGKSSRFKGKEKKPYADLDGRAVWLRSLEIFSIREEVKQILIAVAPEDRELFDRRYRANVAFLSHAKLVKGGQERADSVQNALAACSPDVDFVAVHDTARPCLTSEMVDAVFQEATKTGAAILAARVFDTLKRDDGHGAVAETIARDGLWLAQTPQVFQRRLLLDAYAQRDKLKGPITDDAMLVEALGHKVSLVECDLTNFKITTKQDIALASAIIKSRPKPKDALSFHPFADEQMWK
jgi:2-C-methyl-D-erythritol 4-phosphate cytidylyltransferase